MKNVHQWFDEYGESHQNKTNKTIHWIAIPLIMFSTLGLFWALSDLIQSALGIHLPNYVNLATVLIAGGLLWYLALSIRLGLAMIPVTILMIYVLSQIRAYGTGTLAIVCGAIWVTAWIAQFIGHKIEGKKPSFFKDLQFLLVGPYWLMGKIFRIANLGY